MSPEKKLMTPHSELPTPNSTLLNGFAVFIGIFGEKL